MKVAICDDEKLDREKLKIALGQLEKEYAIELDITEFDNPKKLIEKYASGYKMQVLFLDIYMNEDMGTEAAKYLRDIGYNGSIIFCTSSEEHALTGFKVRADGYLVKPYTYNDFKESIVRIENMLKTEQKKIKFNSDRIEYEVPLADIFMIEADNKGSLVHTRTEKLFTWKRLKEFYEEIEDDNFYQVSRFTVINLDAVTSVQDDGVMMKDGTIVLFTVRDKHKIKQDINDYIWKKMRN